MRVEVMVTGDGCFWLRAFLPCFGAPRAHLSPMEALRRARSTRKELGKIGMRCLRRERGGFLRRPPTPHLPRSSSNSAEARSLVEVSRLSPPQVSEAHSPSSSPPLSPYLSPPSASPSKNTPPPSRSRLRRPRHFPRPRPLRRPQARAPRPVWPALGLRHRRLLPAHGRGRTPRPHALGHVLHRRARVRRHGLRVLPGRAGPARWAQGAPGRGGPRGDDQRHRRADAGVALLERDVWRPRRQPVLGVGRVPLGCVKWEQVGGEEEDACDVE